MKHLFEFKSFYKPGDKVLIEYWYNSMITPVEIIEKVGRSYRVSHNVRGSQIQNAPNELVKNDDIIDHYKTDSM